jgi:predicted lysophospholipase L1 biosynthesis ABC-type transport system permease subunit
MTNDRELDECTRALFFAAQQLGIGPKEATKLMRAVRILSHPYVSLILGVVVGIALGTLHMTNTETTYPYTQSQAILGIEAARTRKLYLIQRLILNVISFLVGFTVSYLLQTRLRPPIMYGVYSQKSR